MPFRTAFAERPGWSPRARWLAGVACLAAAYLLAGRLALLLAIPPGYATAVWPAAGIALAGLLLLGDAAWPAVWLGSFLVNAGTSLDPSDAASLARSLLLAASIGLGAALQALLGAHLIRRSVGPTAGLPAAGRVLPFVLLGGPAACLVGATCGVISLWVSRAIGPGELAFSWWTWWVGDAIGAILFAPLVLILFASRSDARRSLLGSVALPLGVSFAAVVGLFVWVSAMESQRMADAFRRQAEAPLVALEGEVGAIVEGLRSLVALRAVAPHLDRADLAHFAELLARRHSGIQAVEWISGPGDLEALAARQGFGPGSERPVREAFARARDAGEPAASAGIELLPPREGSYAALVFVPAYAGGPVPATRRARRETLSGLALGVLRIGDLAASSMQGRTAPGIALRVEDAGGGIVLHAAPAEGGAGPGSATARAEPSWLAWTGALEIGGRRWSLRFAPTPHYLAQHRSWQAWWFLVTGLLSTAMLGGFLLALHGRREIIEHRTQDLGRLNASLREEVSRRLAAERELAWRAEALEQSNADLDDFAQITAHDLREPLRGISTYARFLLDDYGSKLDADGRHKLETLPRLAKRLDDLLESLLHYSRFGKADLAVRETDLGEVVEDVVESLRVTLEERGVEVRIRAPLPVVRCDSVRIGEVFRNLVTNAVKYNDKPFRWIEIGVVGRSRICYVRDNGVGIREEHLDTVFRIFKRLHAKDQFGGGSGAGLTIAKKIVERHGGRIWVESTPGLGSTFYFTLGAGGPS